jgi:hypothetical protein
VSISTSTKGAKSLNFNITHEGNTQTLYSQTIINNNGDDNEIGQKFLTKLAVIVGADLEDGLDWEEEEHAVGKDNKVQTFVVIQQFSNIDVIMHLQEEYSKYQDEIKKKMAIKSIFRSDKATAEEIVNGTNLGKRYVETEAKYANKITYLNDLTAEDVEEWKTSKSSGGAKSTSKPIASKAPTGGLFKR